MLQEGAQLRAGTQHSSTGAEGTWGPEEHPQLLTKAQQPKLTFLTCDIQESQAHRVIELAELALPQQA